ncbi:LacI family DNA-binding transcriptional regulator [Streptomyces flaveus]|uniref:LacI family transcriptional regulator n=1 Tax=Streptomyces flaveus TaxID=66370 RepID=A0A917VDK8_9ACTN|nr:LacI family DNA-binding transcriptional regulator [Streptomyces flaveus]GGK67139.1 LacI family transcriptional regulator [Streptomyces flaveus]
MSVTLKEVAARAGVSRSLASLAMRNDPRVSARRREAVLKAAAELGYRPNAHAAQLASRRTMTVGVVLVELHNPVYTEIFTGVQEQAEQAGYGVLLTGGELLTADTERRAIDGLLEHRVDGIVLVGPRLASKDLRELADRVPLVVVGRHVQGVDSVAVDTRHGTRLAVEHLVGLGHEDIAHIDGGNGPGAESHRRAYLDTMKQHGLSARNRVVRGDYTEHGGRRAAETLLSSTHPPTAVFAANDLSALGVLAALKHRGMSAPEDLSLVGFDNTVLAQYGYIDLTTIDTPRQDMGATAVTTLTARIEDTGRPTRPAQLAPRLIVRSTTMPHTGV